MKKSVEQEVGKTFPLIDIRNAWIGRGSCESEIVVVDDQEPRHVMPASHRRPVPTNEIAGNREQLLDRLSYVLTCGIDGLRPSPYNEALSNFEAAKNAVTEFKYDTILRNAALRSVNRLKNRFEEGRRAYRDAQISLLAEFTECEDPSFWVDTRRYTVSPNGQNTHHFFRLDSIATVDIEGLTHPVPLVQDRNGDLGFYPSLGLYLGMTPPGTVAA